LVAARAVKVQVFEVRNRECVLERIVSIGKKAIGKLDGAGIDCPIAAALCGLSQTSKGRCLKVEETRIVFELVTEFWELGEGEAHEVIVAIAIA
jgi:hypothetical protein